MKESCRCSIMCKFGFKLSKIKSITTLVEPIFSKRGVVKVVALWSLKLIPMSGSESLSQKLRSLRRKKSRDNHRKQITWSVWGSLPVEIYFCRSNGIPTVCLDISSIFIFTNCRSSSFLEFDSILYQNCRFVFILFLDLCINCSGFNRPGSISQSERILFLVGYTYVHGERTTHYYCIDF